MPNKLQIQMPVVLFLGAFSGNGVLKFGFRDDGLGSRAQESWCEALQALLMRVLLHLSSTLHSKP